MPTENAPVSLSEVGSTKEPTTTPIPPNGGIDAPASASEREHDYIDLSNLDLSSEDEVMAGFDPDADPFQMPAPPDDAIYIARILFASKEVEKRWERIRDKDSAPIFSRADDTNYWLETQLVAVIEDENSKFHGRYAFDRRFVNTKVDRNGATKVAGILKALGIQPRAGHERQAVALTQAIDSGQNLCQVRTAWVVRYQDAADKWQALTGQRKFPKRDDGTPKHFVIDASGTRRDAIAQVMEYSPLGSSA